MVSNLRYSAAKTSVIKKTTGLAVLKKLLPTQKQYKKNLISKKKLDKNGLDSKKSNASSSSTSTDQALEVLGYDVQLDYSLLKRTDLLTAIDTILSNQWAESSAFHHDIYHSPESIANHTAEELLFLLSGLSMATKADIIKYRKQLTMGIVTVNQLYSIYEQEGHTFVDRSLEVLIRQGKLKKFIISNASPVILHSPQAFQLGKVTYGFENIELVVKFSQYLDLIDNSIKELKATVDLPNKDNIEKNIATLEAFKIFLKENPLLLFMSEKQFSKERLNNLVTWGYLTLTSNHLNEIDTNQYEISYPNCGAYLKLINNCRVWLIKLFAKLKYKEYLESQIWEKWQGSGGEKSKMTNFRSPFYGFELNWVLADALGAGVIEVFRTPVGRGWRLTGKI